MNTFLWYTKNMLLIDKNDIPKNKEGDFPANENGWTDTSSSISYSSSPSRAPIEEKNSENHSTLQELSPTKWLNEVFTEAVRLGASDIHIIPEKEFLSVRFRINGVVQEVARWDIDYHDMVISRIKVIAGLQLEEKNIPQDGHIEMVFGKKVENKKTIQSESVNFRISTMPTINGEAIVLRIFSREEETPKLQEIGLSEKSLVVVEKILQRGHGAVLITGHSGSGKTTTLYAALNEISSTEKVIITLEDPVEYRVPGVQQSQVNTLTGYDFDVGLRALLRQDPDAIMVGEIRDEETASIALRLALIGRLILTTLHTDSIAGAIIRLLDMKMQKSVLSSALTGIFTERLVRKICPQCKAEGVLPTELMKMFQITWPANEKVYEGRGCEYCLHTGFVGRTGIFEVLEIDDSFRGLIMKGANLEELRDYVEAHVPQTLREDGFDKVRKGLTTLEEVIRATI